MRRLYFLMRSRSIEVLRPLGRRSRRPRGPTLCAASHNALFTFPNTHALQAFHPHWRHAAPRGMKARGPKGRAYSPCEIEPRAVGVPARGVSRLDEVRSRIASLMSVRVGAAFWQCATMWRALDCSLCLQGGGEVSSAWLVAAGESGAASSDWSSSEPLRPLFSLAQLDLVGAERLKVDDGIGEICFRRPELPKLRVPVDHENPSSVREVAESIYVRGNRIAAGRALTEPGGSRTRRQRNLSERGVF